MLLQPSGIQTLSSGLATEDIHPSDTTARHVIRQIRLIPTAAGMALCSRTARCSFTATMLSAGALGSQAHTHATWR